MGERGVFDESYWTRESQYRKFDDYPEALAALRRWYVGLFRLIAEDLPVSGRALDAGCGHGAVVHELLGRSLDAYGFDVSSWIIEQARAADPRTANRFAVGDLEAVPFAGDFDLVTCLEVFEHVPDPVAGMTALASKLRPGGRLIATTPNLRPLMPWWDAEKTDPTHVSVHEPTWWAAALESSGLQVERVSTFLAVPLLWHVHPLLARWIRLGDRIGPGVLMVARSAQG
jgi:2-polyprenyl-3-methyl-5-hydroxy-6-metoxy-1,4-benzoquinol methylase